MWSANEKNRSWIFLKFIYKFFIPKLSMHIKLKVQGRKKIATNQWSLSKH